MTAFAIGGLLYILGVAIIVTGSLFGLVLLCPGLVLLALGLSAMRKADDA